MASSANKNPGGRPPKFNEISRPVTVTLPERVLHMLTAVNPDRARAITKLADTMLAGARTPFKLVDLVEVAPGKSVILVAHSAYLARIPWLRLIEIAPARHLLSLLPGTPIEKLEVAISDLLEVVAENEPDEREILEVLRHNIRAPRRDQKINKEEILVVESAATARG